MTLGQRVLATPLHMRLHYGHPDILISYGSRREAASKRREASTERGYLRGLHGRDSRGGVTCG